MTNKQGGAAAKPVANAVGAMAGGVAGGVRKTAAVAGKVAALTDRGPFAGFKKFISRGSMIDMAVGVVMGSAVTAVVNSVVEHLINPLIAMIGGKPDLSAMFAFTVNGATVSFGAILNDVINFLMIGVAVYFCVILPINKVREMAAAATAAEKKEDAAAAGPTAEDRTLAVLEEIRDELRLARLGGGPAGPAVAAVAVGTGAAGATTSSDGTTVMPERGADRTAVMSGNAGAETENGASRTITLSDLLTTEMDAAPISSTPQGVRMPKPVAEGMAESVVATEPVVAAKSAVAEEPAVARETVAEESAGFVLPPVNLEPMATAEVPAFLRRASEDDGGAAPPEPSVGEGAGPDVASAAAEPDGPAAAPLAPPAPPALSAPVDGGER